MPIDFGASSARYAQGPLGGSTIDAAYPPASPGFTRGLLFVARDQKTAFINYRNDAGAAAWLALGGLLGSWGKYVVSNQATPSAGYATIQSAIDAAVADGHNNANPATVLVLPGTYPENLTLRPGVRVVGFVATASMAAFITNAPVSINGDVTAAFDVAGQTALENVLLKGQLNFGGTAVQSVSLANVVIASHASNAIVCTNTTSDCELVLSHVNISSNYEPLGNQVLLLSTGARVRITATNVTFGAADGVAADLNNDVLALNYSDISGRIVARVSASATVQFSTWTSSDVVHPLGQALTVAGSLLQVAFSSVYSSAPTTFDGAGDLLLYVVNSFGEITTGSLVVDRDGVAGLQISGNGLSVGGAINAKAICDLQSTTKALFPPRLTTAQKNALAATLNGTHKSATIYDTDLSKLQCWNGAAFVNAPG